MSERFVSATATVDAPNHHLHEPVVGIPVVTVILHSSACRVDVIASDFAVLQNAHHTRELAVAMKSNDVAMSSLQWLAPYRLPSANTNTHTYTQQSKHIAQAARVRGCCSRHACSTVPVGVSAPPTDALGANLIRILQVTPVPFPHLLRLAIRLRR